MHHGAASTLSLASPQTAPKANQPAREEGGAPAGVCDRGAGISCYRGSRPRRPVWLGHRLSTTRRANQYEYAGLEFAGAVEAGADVTAAPAGERTYHRAPNSVSPWPAVWPEWWSATK